MEEESDGDVLRGWVRRAVDSGVGHQLEDHARSIVDHAGKVGRKRLQISQAKEREKGGIGIEFNVDGLC